MVGNQEENTYKIPNSAKIVEDIKLSVSSIFTKSNFILLICFLIVYFILYYIIKMFSNDDTENNVNSQLAMSRTIDIFVSIIFITILVAFYYNLNQTENNDIIGQLLLWTKNFFDDPTTPFSFIIFILIFYTTIYVLQIPMTSDTKPFTIGVIESTLFIVLICVFIINFFKYVFGISLMNLMFGANNELVKLWNKLPDDDSDNKIDSVKDNSGNVVVPVLDTPKEEVFHISNNLYTYDDSVAICSAFDSKLATYDQIEDAYNKGAEWGTYGWSEGQMILFPTQKDTWNKLQKIKGRENDQGRPGINGGFLPNKNIFFGVNCFGIRPSATDLDLNRLKHSNTEPIKPKNINDEIIDAKVKYWRENKDSMLILSSFNKDKWSQY
jgi:hypothetical protein